jgi:hypothetical protein
MKMSEQTRITLEKVKESAFASRETTCFEALLLFDGKPVCFVSNDGQGGCDRHEPLRGKTYHDTLAALTPVRDFVRTLESLDIEGHTLAPDLDLVVGDLLTRWLIERDFKRALAKKWLYTTPTAPNLVYFVSKAKVSDPDRWADAYERHHKHRPNFLHTLPPAEALDIYRRGCQ